MKTNLGRFGFAIALLALGETLSAAPIVLDFEDLAGSPLWEPMPAVYGGIEWDRNFWAYDQPQDPYNPKSGIVRIAANSSQYGNSWFSFIGAKAQFDGMWFSGATEVSMELYADGVLVHTTPTLQTTGTPTFLSSDYTGPVDTVHILGLQWYYTFDDLQYTPVPEPAVGAVLLAGLAVLGLVARGRDRVQFSGPR